MTVKEATEKGYLENKVVFLKLLPKKTEMAKDPDHIAYGGFDGSLRSLTIGVDKNNRKVNPFVNEEEQKFFEGIFKTDLNVYGNNNVFWTKYAINIVKSPELIKIGKKFDLRNPEDALNYKVLLTNHKLVSKTWEARNPFHMFAFIDEDHEEIESEKMADEQQKIWTFLGEIKHSPTKMQDFLRVYHTSNRNNKIIPENATKEFLVNEIQKIIKEDKKGYLTIVEDKDYKTKVFIETAIEVGVITKEGIATFYIQGLEKGFSYEDLIALIEKMEREKRDPLYITMLAQIEKKRKGK